ncbi:TonB-dependent receptor [Arachidicoccus terrestris]|uniref:TonB-dependent receptor n=1 Tax=Arachidicoccus terrestris TaxID=2875539 RepID=UPI001CC7D4CB|nr:TonB-dependent receptor [Arachidicoccus terrestris]UAY54954.1 TonB-dependent receptor [Arachidicoccus terrestris]
MNRSPLCRLILSYTFFAILMSFSIILSAQPVLTGQDTTAQDTQQPIRGRVTDRNTGQPIVGVTIQFKTSCCCEEKGDNCQCISGANGSFIIPYKSTGSYCNMQPDEDCGIQKDTLIISAVNYQTTTFILDQGQVNAPITVELTPSDNNLAEVLVTAARFRQNRSDIPAAIGIVDSLQLALTKATSINQLINQVPGVFMADLGNEQHEMSIRQPITTKSLFLYLEDGMPIRASGLYNHNALLEMNLAATNRIEVLKGPASAQYGPEAIGGAVNLISATAPPELSGKLTVEADNNGYKKSSVRIGDSFGKLGVILSGYYANRHNGPIDYSDFHKSAFTLNSVYQFSPSLRWENKATYVDYYADMSGSLDSLAFAQKDFTSHYRFTYRKVKAFRTSSILTKAWNQQATTKFSFMYRSNQTGQNPSYRIKDNKTDPLSASGEINMNAFRSYVGLLQHHQQFKWQNSVLIMGLNADISPSQYQAQFISIRKNNAGDYIHFNSPDSLLTDYHTDINNYAAFVQWQMDLASGLRLTLAGRYDRFDYDFKNHLNSTAVSGAPSSMVRFNHWTPKAGLNYNLKQAGFYANYAEGFVPPQVTELFNNVKVPFLDPQVFHNYEIGGWWRLKKSKMRLDWSLYRMNGTGEIISVRNNDGSSENKNAGKTSHTGLELGISYKPGHQWDLRLGGTLASHKFREETQGTVVLDGNHMQAAPAWLGNGVISYRPDFIKGLHVSLEYQQVGRYYMDDANTTRYKGFRVINLRAGYQWGKTELWAHALNLLDQYYADVATKSSYGYSYNPGNPFTLAIGLAYNF